MNKMLFMTQDPLKLNTVNKRTIMTSMFAFFLTLRKLTRLKT